MNPSENISGTSACDPARLDQFLQSDHYRIENAELVAHLDVCPSCVKHLESRAGDAKLWKSATTLLRPCEFDHAGSHLFSAGGTVDDASGQPIVIQEVLDALAPTDHPHSLGRIGTHEVTGVVGVGGMGVVLKAIDPSLDRVVAVKVMAPRLANNETARKRFAREAKAAAAVLHPNVVPIHGVSSDKALPYLVMAYIRGGSLQKRLEEQGPLHLVEILRIGSQIAAGLAAAHEQGLVHRDIKPENVLLEEGVERVTITDFGLARAVDDHTVTQAGAIAGTPLYMSPEQARGDQLDQQSDLFSLGSVLYALSTGRPPYLADSSFGVMRRIIDDSPAPIRTLNSDIPEWFAAVVETLMSKKKADRFATAGEVHKLLEACLSHVQQPHFFPLPEFSGVCPYGVRRPFNPTRTGILAMSLLTSATIVVTAFLVQPERSSLTVSNASPPPVAAETHAPLAPALIVESHKQESSEGEDKTLTHRWKLKGRAVGKMEIRVLHIENGTSRVVTESVYQGGTTGEDRIEVELQIKEFVLFPGNVCIPTLAVSVNGLQATAEAGEQFTLLGDFKDYSVTSEGQLGPEHVLMTAALHGGGMKHSRTLASMLEASKQGATFLVTTLDWQSVEQLAALKSDDRRNIQGIWQVTYSEDGGRIAPQEMLKNLRFVFTQENMTMQMGDHKSESTFQLNPGTSPKSIDITERGRTKQGIYDLQGDTLRICIAEQTEARPTVFDSQPNSANDVIILMKRIADTTAAQ